MTKQSNRALGLLLVLIITMLLAARQAIAGDWSADDPYTENRNANTWQASVDPDLLTGPEDGPIEFILLMREQADLTPAGRLRTKEAKGAFVYNALRASAERTQRDLLDTLSKSGAQYRSFWIVNAVWVRGQQDLLPLLAKRQDVKVIAANPALKGSLPGPDPAVRDIESTGAVEWNIQQIGAPTLWDNSISGQGVVIGGQDTGYDWEHPALKSQYRGWDGQAVDHDYNWHDAILSSNGPCGGDSPEPCDDHGHGTHTMGTMVGDDGAGNRIGVAPGARWIGCRNMDRGVGKPDIYLDCFQWFIAPTEIGGDNPDPSKAPHIINNSWSCPTSEGCTDPDVLRLAVEAVRAAGILTVQSAGNSGSSCASIDNPAAIYDATFTVGATSSAGNIASFSSRGPVMVDGSGRPKPDVVAPGVGVRSSYLGDIYATLSGTSMAAPHVAGLAALLIASNPALAGDVDRLEQLMTMSAVRDYSTQDCFDMAGDQIPNAVYGYGHVDAPAAERFANGSRFWLVLIAKQAPIGQPFDSEASQLSTEASSP